MKAAPENVRVFLCTEFRKLIEQDYIHEWVSCHLEYPEQRRVDLIVKGLTEFIRQ